MNMQKHRWILYLITATIIATIGVQFYWNYKNYQQNKQRVTNEIQLSLDNAVEEYFSSLAKSDFLTIVKSNTNKNKSKKDNYNVTLNNLKITTDENMSKEKVDSMMISMKEFMLEFDTYNDSTNINQIDSTIIMTQFTDHNSGFHLNKNGTQTAVKYFKGKKAADSLKFFTDLKPIFISFLDQSLSYKEIDSLINKQLKNKGIQVKHSFHHLKNDTLFHQTKDTVINAEAFSVSSKSTFVRENEAFRLIYNNTDFVALKRSSLGIFLSLLLSLLIISCLFYLLKIINQQKELATIKNDLISNITHEFKTPIATVSTAIEAIENFNVIDDKVKTKKYLAMSSLQLKKLHQMVEKLLETATLDSEQLLLKKEQIDVVEITNKLVTKHKMLAKNKIITFTSNLKPIYLSVDVFHFENVISNLIDNAVKYGGNNIEININSILKSTEITIADDGNGIEKHQQEKIFDKFYRVPKGNTHNVKGFGIGLYYCKKIIEKHTGTIFLSSDKKQTIFKITIPNE